MYIDNTKYSVDLNGYHNLRSYMIANIYCNMEFITSIMNLISNKIDCLDISYDASRYTICLNIKKTTMRRSKDYNASSVYYYGIMHSVFTDFFNLNPQILKAVSNLIPTGGRFDNLCQVYCIGDKTVEIRL